MMEKSPIWSWTFLCLISCLFASWTNRNDFWRVFERNIAVDPNDRVNVERWNQLNEEDMQRMPVTENYSDEKAAETMVKMEFSYFPPIPSSEIN